MVIIPKLLEVEQISKEIKKIIYIYKTENKNIMANIYRLEAYDSIMCECVDTFLLIYRFYGKKAC